jgi:hypothetical protein
MANRSIGFFAAILAECSADWRSSLGAPTTSLARLKPQRCSHEQLVEFPGREPPPERYSEQYIDKLHSEAFRDVEVYLHDCAQFNSSEKRLARLLLVLAKFGKEGSRSPISPNISQETLAEMIGTTRSPVSFFL